MTQDTDQYSTVPTHPLPTNYVIGVVEQWQEAEQAVQALHDAGHAAQDILLFRSQVFIEGLQGMLQQSSPLARAAHIFFTSSDEGFPGNLYLQHAQRGAHVLAVYTPTVDKAEQIAQVLSVYHVHLLKYFSRWTTTDFPS